MGVNYCSCTYKYLQLQHTTAGKMNANVYHTCPGFLFFAFIIVTMIHSYMILRFLLLNVNFIMNWLDVKETHTEKNNTRVREMKEKSQSLAKLMRKDVKF